ncbi:MAG: alpha-D-ribose 1-methylphosphonate 5-phosphate C-P-lyase PhnJ [Pseudomonadota bacterium]
MSSVHVNTCCDRQNSFVLMPSVGHEKESHQLNFSQYHSQQMFRCILDAMARPALVQKAPVIPSPLPAQMPPMIAAIALTLCDGDTPNAVSIRAFFEQTTAVATTTHTADATIIQTRHRIPEEPLKEGQIMVYQVPVPEPLRWLEPSEEETRTLHALEEYGIMNVKLYEDIMRHGTIATGFDYPAKVNDRYIVSPSPIPRFDNTKLHQSPALQLFGAGREKRLYAIPPYTDVQSLDFEDYPFTVQSWDAVCAICGASDTYLDEVILDDAGERMFVCSDSDCCAKCAAKLEVA